MSSQPTEQGASAVTPPSSADQPLEVQFELVEPHAAALIESMRAVGYTPQTAIADLIDNSLSAGAHNVWLSFLWDGDQSYVSLRDDGHGMTEAELSNAMRLGSPSPLTKREPSDLGRFGLGLKTASFSQCRRLTVCSKRAAGSPAVRRWDLDYVNLTNEWRLLTAAEPGSEGKLEALGDLASGTVVLWEVMDRLVEPVSADHTRAQRRFLDLARSVESHLAMVFHRFLSRPGGLDIWLNGSRIDPWDPFLSGEAGVQRLAEETLSSGSARVVVHPYILPHHSKLTPEKHQAAAGPSGWNGQQGFYIYRNQRLLVPGDWLRLGFEKEEHCKLARIQVDLPNSLDDDWNIDVKKSTARPPGALRDDLRRIATVTRQRASEVYRHRGKVIARAAAQEYSFVWSSLVRHGKIHYRVNRKHPLVDTVRRELGKGAEDLEAILRLVEETVPIPLIALDVSEKPDSMSSPYDGVPRADLMAVLERMYRALRETGLSESQAKTRLAVIEPFDRFPELIASFDEQVND